MKKELFLKNIGNNIRLIRKEKGLSQVVLAKKIGKDQQSIQRLETGNINPSIYYLQEVADGLEVDLLELIKS